ncbi:MAG: hypothetical protein ACTS3F_10935 [Phycisphaerales bacterium]
MPDRTRTPLKHADPHSPLWDLEAVRRVPPESRPAVIRTIVKLQDDDPVFRAFNSIALAGIGVLAANAMVLLLGAYRLEPSAYFGAPLVFIGLLPVIFPQLVARRRQRLACEALSICGHPTCERCGYDCRFVPAAVCPECGHPLTLAPTPPDHAQIPATRAPTH